MGTREYLLFRLQELWKNTAYFQQRPKFFIFIVDDKSSAASSLKEPRYRADISPAGRSKESAKTFLRELVKQVKGLRSVKLSSTKSKKEL